ncbi:MAG: hypothetical protein IJH34_14880, partial [Romboutsia sp.]|nr:hypothetical protein [Romboutsia sp.]
SLTLATKSATISQSYFDSKMLLKLTFDESKIINDITKKVYTGNGKYEEGTKILGYMPNNNYTKITDIDLSKENSITVSFSFKFDSDSISDTTKDEKIILPISLNDGKYNLKITNKKLGFTTNDIDLFGTEYNFQPNKWYNIIATFNKDDMSRNKLFINGTKLSTYQVNGTPIKENLKFDSNNIYISGNEKNQQHMLKDGDIIDEIYLLKGSINDSEVNYLYLYSRIPEFRVDKLDLSKPTTPKVDLSWGLDILDTDLLAARFYDSSSEQSFHWGGNGVGKQELTTEEVYQGKYSYKVTDTVTKLEGNHYQYPYTNTTKSIHTFNRLYNIPPNEYVSMSIKLKSKTPNSYYRLNGDGGWETGREFDYYKAKLTKDAQKGSKVIYVDDINEFKRQASPNNNLPSIGYWITSDTDKDIFFDSIQIKEIYTLEEYESKLNSIELNTDNTDSQELPIGAITEFDYEKIRVDSKASPTPGVIVLFGSIQNDIKSGQNLKARKWHGALSFSQNIVIPDDKWHVYNSNTYTKYNEYYDLSKRGMSLYANTSTSGVLYADSLKFGYATKAIVRRSGQVVYEGYDSKFTDNNAKDSGKPNIVNKDTIITNVNFKNEKEPTNSRVMSIIFDKVEDIGTKYNYTIQSISRSGNSSPESNPILVDVKTDIKGYSYVIDKNKNTKVDTTIDTIKEQDDNKNLIEHEITESGLYYLHIAAIDNAGNISETLHFPIGVPELEAEANHKGDYIDLKWSMNDNNEPFQFKVFKKRIDEDEYQSGSMMNFEDDTEVKVLNVYPNQGNHLKTWMEDNGYGKGIIKVDAISIDDFNSNPSSYLKGSDDNWKYDVIMFGTWDANNYLDINLEARNVVE